MRQLPDLVQPLGTGIPELEARLLRREGNLCLYKRSDDVYEVFYPNRQAEGMIIDKLYPARETYPGNEDFGKTAWCFRSREAAERKFIRLLEWRGGEFCPGGAPVEAQNGIISPERYQSTNPQC